MDRTERFHKIDQLVTSRRIVSFATLKDALGVSDATLKRDLQYLRDRLGAPLVWDAQARGYRYDSAAAPDGGAFELPGLWFNASEIHALLTMQHLLATLDRGGLLTPHIEPLMARLNGLLGSADDTAEAIRKRVLIVGSAVRRLPLAHFEAVGSALLRRRRLAITYHARSSDATTERVVSPQRLVHYRENWYLDAWCHTRRALRNFALDAIQRAEILDTPAREVAEQTTDATLNPGYGIFAGAAMARAQLRFSAERARWVAHEQWHPDQHGRFDAAGRWLLDVPYADDRELVMDILKYGPDVEVLGPPALRERLRSLTRALAAQYDPGVA